MDFIIRILFGIYYLSFKLNVMLRVKRLIKSFTYALHGLVKTFKEEQNLQIQTIAAAIVIVLAFFLKVERLEWVILILVIALVILMEIANSAVERIADVLRPRINSYVKEIKDITAAAVMIASLAAIIIGVIIFYPYLVK